MELEVGEALLAAEAKLDEKTLSEVQNMLVEGREYLDIVRFGNGVHNKKYAIMILDEAFAQFEDALLIIEGE
jgi:hypothetical protein